MYDLLCICDLSNIKKFFIGLQFTLKVYCKHKTHVRQYNFKTPGKVRTCTYTEWVPSRALSCLFQSYHTIHVQTIHLSA